MVTGVRQLQRKTRVRQPVNELHTTIRRPINKLCTEVRLLMVEDLYDGVRELQLGARQLPMDNFCVGVKQLQLEDMIETRQLPTTERCSSDVDNSHWMDESSWN